MSRQNLCRRSVDIGPKKIGVKVSQEQPTPANVDDKNF